MPKFAIHDRTFQFSLLVLKSLSQWGRDEGYNIVRKQALRSGTSIGANVVEAQQSSSKQEFLRYIQIALRSSRETEYWLRLASNMKDFRREEILHLLSENQQLSKILASILITGKGINK